MNEEWGKLQVKMGRDGLTVENRLYTCLFKPETAGFPARLGLAGEPPLLETGVPLLTAKLTGRRQARPCLERLEPRMTRQGDTVSLVFDAIPWRDEKGVPLEGFRLALEYEFHPDGAVFTQTCFFVADTASTGLHDFVLAPVLRLSGRDEADWAYWTLPGEFSAKIIQDIGSFERGLGMCEQRELAGKIAPFVSFDMGADGRRDKHAEFFVEAWNSVAGPRENTATRVDWHGREARIKWNFQVRPVPGSGRAPQWRNTWGWCLRRFPVERRPPLRVCHYLDNFTRYPDPAQMRAIAASGADTLILHENWRLDMPGDAFAHDRAALERTRRACRRLGLRLGLYVRGNEPAIRERLAEPFRPWLKRNIDGIYMDFGGPMGTLSRSENAPGGRLHFRENHRLGLAIREFVGRDGFFISHTGSFFSAIGQTAVDAYLGGEQEKGRLLESPTLHAYFSGLSVAPGALWTAAFPTYRSARALPLLATTGQTPFLHLGAQFPTSSLAHPDTPAVVTFARPLWRLWALLDGERNLRFYSTSGGPRVLRTDGPHTGASLFVTAAGDGLLILANYTDRARTGNVSVDHSAAGLPRALRAFRLEASEEHTACTSADDGETFESALAPFGLEAFLLTNSPRRWRGRIARFIRPYPVDRTAAEAWRVRIETIRRQRFVPQPCARVFMQVEIPNFPNNYEDSIWDDLFENDIELVVSDTGGARSLGFVTSRGLAGEAAANARLRPGVASPWMALHVCLPPGTHHLALVTRRAGGEFYSFVKARLSPLPRRCAQTYEVVYTNDIDSDWSRLDFAVDLRPGAADPAP